MVSSTTGALPAGIGCAARLCPRPAHSLVREPRKLDGIKVSCCPVLI